MTETTKLGVATMSTAANTTIRVIRSSSVDASQGRVVAEFATLPEAREYIQRNTVDGLNVSHEVECDYLHIDGE